MNEEIKDCKNTLLNTFQNIIDQDDLNKLLNVCKSRFYEKDITYQNKLAVYKEGKIGIVLDFNNFKHPNHNASREICSGKDITSLFNESSHCEEAKRQLLSYAIGYLIPKK
jgi:hypothetical protein